MFKRLFSAWSEQSPSRGKPGARAYGVGDVHGRLDLLDRLLADIERDIAGAPAAETFVVFLGDLIDRGPDSAGVVERVRSWKFKGVRPVHLLGNHEEIFLDVLDAKPGLLYDWLRFGGAECAQSYGVSPDRLQAMDEAAAAELLRRRVPAEHIGFLKRCHDTFRFGDYLFVHAGVRPGLPLDRQSPRDLRWIREPFLTDRQAHGFTVVHGHTITPEVEERPNRIGIDTGAYRTGVLTAIVLDGERRRYLRTEPDQAGVAGPRGFA